jgi:hypothetical protein
MLTRVAKPSKAKTGGSNRSRMKTHRPTGPRAQRFPSLRCSAKRMVSKQPYRVFVEEQSCPGRSASHPMASNTPRSARILGVSALTLRNRANKDAGQEGCGSTKKKPQISPLRYAPVEMTNLLNHSRSIVHWVLRVFPCNKFVISTEAQRSGEISVVTPLPGNVFRQSAAQWRDLRFLFSAHVDSKALRFPFKFVSAAIIISRCKRWKRSSSGYRRW